MSITFAIAGRSDLTMERGRIIPYVPIEYKIDQLLHFTEQNNPKVTDYGSNIQFIKLSFKHLSKDQYDGTVNGLETWFSSSQVNWAANSFTMTDEEGNTHTVRFWQNSFQMTRDAGGRYTVSFVLLKE